MIEKIKTQVNIQKRPNCLIEVDIKVSKDLIHEAEIAAIKEVKKEISISGFRKGKAPDELIKKNYSDRIKHCSEKKLADLSFIEAHKEHKLPSISAGSKIVFKLKSLNENEAELFYTYETEPEVPKVDPAQFQLKKLKKHPVTEKEVDEAIKQARFFFAKYESVERPILENDYIIIDLDSIKDGKDTRVFSDTRFEVSKTGVSKWMLNLVLGAKHGDVLEGISQPDEDASEEDKKNFEKREVKVTIKTVEEVTLPEPDDEFAKKLGSQTVEEMKKSIKSLLEKQAEDAFEKDKRTLVDEFLLKEYDFDIPPTLLHSEVASRKDSFIQDPRNKLYFEKMSDKEKNNFEKEIEKHAKNAIKIFFISRKIIDDFEIKISNNEIKNEAVDIIYKRSKKIVDPNSIPKETFALALSKLVLLKAQDYILQHCTKS